MQIMHHDQRWTEIVGECEARTILCLTVYLAIFGKAWPCKLGLQTIESARDAKPFPCFIELCSGRTTGL